MMKAALPSDLTTMHGELYTGAPDIAVDSVREADDLATVYNNVLNVGLAVLFVLSILSNSQLVCIFIRKPALRNVSNQFIINLLITNLTACWSILPILYYDSVLYNTKDIQSDLSVIIACVIEGITAGMCTASVFSVVLIAVDQYFAVLEPLRYHTIIRKRARWQLFFISWTVSLLVGLMGVGNTFYSSAYASIYPILFSLIIFIIPFVVICYIYFCIYWAAHENSLRTRNNCSSSLFNECSNSELRMSHDSVLKETDGKQKRCSRYQKQCHEALSAKIKHEAKPLLKDRKTKHCGGHKAVKVSKPNELYPITSIEDIDLLMADKKSSPTSPEKTLESVNDEQIVMKIDNRNDMDAVDGNSDLLPVETDGMTESTKHPMFFVTRNNNTILKVNNNNVKMSSLNRQLISNTIVTSLSKSIASGLFQENKDSPLSLSENHSLASMSDQNTSSVISLSQVDTYSLASSMRNNESVVSLSSYNPSIASSISDITLSNACPDVVSYLLHDELLSSYFCDKEFLASLNVNKTDLSREHEPVSSLKGRDHYVRISLGCYNGIENIQVVPKLDDVIDENISCDKLSCKNTLPLELDSRGNLDTSSQSASSDMNPVPGHITETTSEICDKDSKPSQDENPSTCGTDSCSKPAESDAESEKKTSLKQCEVAEKRIPACKERLFKKNICTDDRRKQFYENERRKSNDSKASSDDMEAVTRSSQYYRNVELFQCPREKTRSIDSVVSRSGVRSFHHSSTRSSLKSTSSTLVNSLKHRFSNASMFKYREESRTAKISLSVIVLALLSWLPFTILLLLHSPLFNVINYAQYSSFTFEKFAILCLSFHFVGSPLLFALRNKKIKREMIKMWRSWICFFRRQDEEKTRLRNSFYNDYHINKQRLQALKERQRLESLKNGAVTPQEYNQVLDNAGKTSDVVIQIKDDKADQTVDKTFLSRLLAMKQKCCDSTKAWGAKCMDKASSTQRSSISSNTVSTSATDVGCEV